ncbi:MAG: hypothetical protein D6688_00370 [Alphaproteobacteria bacterium]|nr:MAG: hypothetical protein D6688_00370 [Alphaproteobacteria bacterium]
MRRVDDIPYSGRYALTLDLFLPEDRPAEATIIYLHGGGFRRGRKRDVGSQLFAPRLTAEGFAVASVEYRLNTTMDAFSEEDAEVILKLAVRARSSGLTFSPKLYGPALFAALEDVSEAIQFLWVEGEGYGIRSRRVGILGVSAGGIIGASLSFPPNVFLNRLVRPDAAVGISAAVVHPWRLGSPGSPVLLFHGRKDRIIPEENVAMVARKAAAVNAPLKVIWTGVKGHSSQVPTVHEGRDPEGVAYFDYLLEHFAPLKVGA